MTYLLGHVQKFKISRYILEEKATQVLRLDGLLNCSSPFLFFSFLNIFAAVIYWNCLQFKNFQEDIIKTGNSYHGVAKCKSQEILIFQIKFLSIFVYISGLSKAITLIWVSWERSFPPTEFQFQHHVL